MRLTSRCARLFKLACRPHKPIALHDETKASAQTCESPVLELLRQVDFGLTGLALGRTVATRCKRRIDFVVALQILGHLVTYSFDSRIPRHPEYRFRSHRTERLLQGGNHVALI